MGKTKSSSACTLATQVDGKAAFAETLGGQTLFEDLDLFAVLTWTENKEDTGLWSENLDSPLTYHICLSPSPFHNILSHLKMFFPRTNLTVRKIVFINFYTSIDITI